MDVNERLAEAERHALAGDVTRAEELARGVLRDHPDHVEALYMLGMFRSAAGDTPGAEELLARAVAADPRFELAHASLGAVRLAAGRVEEAVASIRAAVAIDPDFAEAHEALAAALSRAGHTAEAAEAWRRVIALRPDHADAYVHLTALLARLGRPDETVDVWARAVERFPGRADMLAGYAFALCRVRRIDDALEAGERALRLDLACAPAYFAIHQALQARRQAEEALAVIDRLLVAAPENANAHHVRGLTLLQLGELDDARTALMNAVRFSTSPIQAAQITSTLLMVDHYVPDLNSSTLYRRHVEWAERYAPCEGRAAPADEHRVDDPPRPLRVGFVSGDFRSHPVADFAHALLAHHDRERFRFFAYSDVDPEDAVTAEFRGLVPDWRPVAGATDAEVERQVREDRIDVLIDLVGHAAEHRLLVFARRPAPVQVTYLGYCDTTGLPAIDYVIGDAVTDPPGAEQPYAERLLRLPGGFACYTPPADAPAVNALPAHTRGDRAVTFGSLHRLAKLNEQVVALWSRVLRAVPGSRMLIFRDALSARPRRRLTAMFARYGIAADRLEFRNALPPGGDSMIVYNDIDVALDAFPWSGHTTACESLWMGVPFVTLRGTTHAGRMAASALVHAGRAEWVADNADHYVSIAARLAADPATLDLVRRSLRESMRASRLCDGVTFTREFEAMLRAAWNEATRGTT